MTLALIAFGANLGDVRASFDQSVSRIGANPSITLVEVATPVVTRAVSGKTSSRPSSDTSDLGIFGSADVSPDYLNSVLSVETDLNADELLQVTQRIENDLGRQRNQRWGPRTVDLDILLFGDQILDYPHLQIPHPRMSFRKFVLGPAVEIAAQWVDPVSGVCLKELGRRLGCGAGHRVDPCVDSASANILWVTRDFRPAQSLTSSFAMLTDGKAATFEIARDLDHAASALGDYRLLLFSGGRSEFYIAAKRFAGPWLDLSELGPADLRREIVGAIEAMQ
jgi:2-amino-4-hydroxy-6-hydroxymethyldihydropteridine diphosphokinase